MKYSTIYFSTIIFAILVLNSCIELFDFKKVEAEIEIIDLTYFPKDSIVVKFDINILDGQPPFEYHWKNPSQFTDHGPYSIALNTTSQIDLLITDSNNDQFELVHEFQSDTIDKLIYDYRNKYTGSYYCEFIISDYDYSSNQRIDSSGIRVINVVKDEEFNKIITTNTISIDTLTHMYIEDSKYRGFYSGLSFNKDSIFLNICIGAECKIISNYKGIKIQ